MNPKIRVAILLGLGLHMFIAHATSNQNVISPAQGVICDMYFCADSGGVSDALTTTYLGKEKGEQLAAQGKFNRSAFTFANGAYCDVKAKVCRKDRYFGDDGQPSGEIDITMTNGLFGH
ncbi:hypothetical protein FS594_02390 [Rahnella aquatilis]|nr:hypothetical protein FS594_02390 [Rahnella aquatilis]